MPATNGSRMPFSSTRMATKPMKTTPQTLAWVPSVIGAYCGTAGWVGTAGSLLGAPGCWLLGTAGWVNGDPSSGTGSGAGAGGTVALAFGSWRKVPLVGSLSAIASE